MVVLPIGDRFDGADDFPLGDAVVLVEIDLRVFWPIAVGGEGDEQSLGRLLGRLLRENDERGGAEKDQEKPTRHSGVSGTRNGKPDAQARVFLEIPRLRVGLTREASTDD